jgi:uncharacterized protein (DUF934 family)
MKFIDPIHDEWQKAENDVRPTPRKHLLLTLTQWFALRTQWPKDLAVGVQLANDEEVEALRYDARVLSLVTLEFPRWTDGRAYSQARVLRTRLRFTGEIRATGEVLVDMLPLLQRTGFDAVQLHPGQQLDSAQRSLRFFASHYQGDTLEVRPAFGRERPSVQASLQ